MKWISVNKYNKMTSKKYNKNLKDLRLTMITKTITQVKIINFYKNL